MKLWEKTSSYLIPPPKLLVSQWAERYRYLSSDTGATGGRWKNNITPYLVGVMDAFNDPNVETIVFMKSARVGGTEAINNIIGYCIANDPCPIGFYQPTQGACEDYSNKELAALIANTPSVKANITKDTVMFKGFNGGSLRFKYSTTADQFRRETFRFVAMDEVDEYPQDIEGQGSPIKLALNRTITYKGRRKHILVGTPTVAGVSIIEKWYNLSDQRRYHVPCHYCGHSQVLVFEQVDAEGYRCVECDPHWDDNQRIMAVRKGDWIAKKPGGKIAGFHINALYSFFVNLADILAEFETVKDDVLAKKTFYNTVLGLPFADAISVEIEDSALASHVSDYGRTIPFKALFLTAGVDVQADRFEVSLWAWAKTGESWLITHHVIKGNTNDATTKRELDLFLAKEWRHESGQPMVIARKCIDTGYNTQAMYEFIAPRQTHSVIAIKGHYKADSPFIGKPHKLPNGCILFMLNVSAMKRQLYYQLTQPPSSNLYVNLKASVATTAYLEGLVGEKLVQKQKNGKTVEVWEKKHPKIRNEPLDCWVYAYAGLKIKEPNWEALENYYHATPMANHGAQQTKVINKHG